MDDEKNIAATSGKTPTPSREELEPDRIPVISGSGAILLFRFDAEKVERDCFVPSKYQGLALGGLGAVLALDYHQTPIGPFKELVLIPGKFKNEACADRLFDASQGADCRISTKVFASDDNGTLLLMNSPGLTQEVANIQIEKDEPTLWNFGASTHDSEKKDSFFSAGVEPLGPTFPLSSAIVPLSFLADHASIRFRATVSCRAVGRLASLHHLRSDSSHFIDGAAYSPLATFYLESFNIELPLLKRSEYRSHNRSFAFHP